MLRACDNLASDMPSLLGRMHLEQTVIRQFVERKNDLLRFYVPIQHVITDLKPLPAYADAQKVKDTESIPLPDIYPLEPMSYMFPTHVYNDETNFPVQPLAIGQQLQNVHSGIEHNNNMIKVFRKQDGYDARSLVLGFLTALGQAKLVYGPDVQGELPVPVTVNFISTDSQKFHFSAYQLNTLDFSSEEGIKNIYWCDKNMDNLYQTCAYVKGVPVLEGYNPSVFKKFAALYLENAK